MVDTARWQRGGSEFSPACASPEQRYKFKKGMNATHALWNRLGICGLKANKSKSGQNKDFLCLAVTGKATANDKSM